MAETLASSLFSTMEEPRNWLELPRDVTVTILMKLEAFEILETAQFVGKLWYNICKDPSMWRSIVMQNLDEPELEDKHQKMLYNAVDRSFGGLINLNIEGFGCDQLISYISLRCMALLRRQLSISPTNFRSSRTTNIHYPTHSSLPPGTITDFVWKDYSPNNFRNILDLENVDYDEYMLSVCNHEILMELNFRGCGKPFYVPHDDRFVIKILRKSEAKILLEMLPSYYAHIQKHKNSLLAKYYGLHATRPGSGGTKVYFVVMENLLRTEKQIHKQYDLKGSSQGRSATKNGNEQRLTLKDYEFDLCFYLNPSIRSQILEQIKLDCKYLEEQGIMDYSLLLGLHVRRDSGKGRPFDNSKQVQSGMDNSRIEILEPYHSRDPTFSHFSPTTNKPNAIRFGAQVQARAIKLGRSDPRTSPSESTRSSARIQDCNNVYLFLGIIDFLQSYNMVKRLEHAYKSFQYDPKTISSVNPNYYATRFQDFLCKVFLSEELGSPESDGYTNIDDKVKK